VLAGLLLGFMVYQIGDEGAGGFNANIGYDMEMVENQNFEGVNDLFTAFPVSMLDDESRAAEQNRGNSQTEEQAPWLVLSVSGAGLQDMTKLTLRDAAETAMERPGTEQFPVINLGFSDETKRQFVLKNLKLRPGDERSVPLSFASTQAGNFTLNLSGYQGWDSDVEVVLIDHDTGEEHIFGAEQAYSFTYEPREINLQRQKLVGLMSAQDVLAQTEVLKLKAESRFEMRLTKGATISTAPAAELPLVFALEQN